MNVDFAANPDAQWNWTVVNGTSFEPIEGHVNQTGEFIDLSSIDWEKYRHYDLRLRWQVMQVASVPKSGQSMEEGLSMMLFSPNLAPLIGF